MSAAPKDVMYVDLDDEITGLIDKVRQSESKIVALVLPKRAAVLQSPVNMKLLKRSADTAKKRVVLITSETGIISLAGAAGLYVAHTLQSKPFVPAVEEELSEPISVIDSDSNEPKLDKTKPIGALAGLKIKDDETIEVDQDVPEATGSSAAAVKPDKKLKVPNFERFRLAIILGGGALVLLLIGFFVANAVLPKARIVIKTDTSSITTDFDMTAATDISELDEEGLRIPLVQKEIKKTDSEKVAATGQRDDGTKASGEVSLKNCSQADGRVTVPAGTGLSTNNLTFITQEAVTLPASSFSGGSRTCTTAVESVDVVAQKAGDQYNISSGRTWSVAGFSGINGTDNTAMTGGTSKIVKVVSQQDIDGAKQKLTERSSTNAKEELQKELDSEGLISVPDTDAMKAPVITSTPRVNEEASEVTVSLETIYAVQAVKKDDLSKLIESQAKNQIDTDKQDIQDNGIDQAGLRIKEKRPNGSLIVSVQSVVVAGPQFDIEAVRNEVAGKKRGETEEIIQSRPGIRDVTIDYSPFWVYSTPKKTDKITIVFEKNETE